ncbi:restriction endonuclease [Thermus scotoductus]|uniref:Restriction endonuclease n=1 Tax=Thermus scotoductus TaxID=37636 RepID=A0A430S7J0_THESC|nr:restriction endonuclease subunit S [Thermus scotoductus]RTG94573.1 restriction endonuclease [Thermus scotoductus]RTH08642.1 restriction endonuclease [Thermus scotoductus]RTH09977.1 restriction endonuclease [Thermus scotoductus]RTH10853.1 restriction endonuclease [Thermus scotoductus]RTH26762.1 restriction endonuclease [Thermus scotoductus]
MKIEAIPAEATRFKETELGPLPEEWRVVRLGEVAEIQTGKREKGGARTDCGVFSIGGEHITEDGRIDFLSSPKYVSNSFFDSIKKGKVQLGDTLVVKDGARTGKSAFVRQIPPMGMAVNEHVFIIRPKGKNTVEGEFIGFYFRSDIAWEQIRSAYHGLIGGINKREMASFILPLPPLPEQQAIAYVLRTVQESKEATERVITVLRELKKSLMRHLFTYGPVPVDAIERVELQETEIGPLPAHWRVVRLREVVELRKGTVSPAEVPEARYVGLEHIDSGEIRIRRFGKASDTRSAKAIFHAGDILYGKLRPYLDKAALAEWDGVCSTDILVLISTEAVDRTFAAYLMHTDFVLHHAIATTTGVNHPRTSWKSLSQATIPLPPLPEQQEIARMLQAVDARIEAEEKKKAALEALFRTLLHHLMTAKIRLPEEFVARFAEVTP